MRRSLAQPTIVILGAGKIGQAIAHFLRQASSVPPIHFWDKDPTKVDKQLPLSEILPQAAFVFYCIPSWGLKTALDDTRDYIKKTTTVLCLSKGIEPTSHKTIDELLQESFPSHPLALLLGPMLADEILSGHPGFATVATKNQKIGHLIQSLFRQSDLELVYVSSLKDAAFASVLKNVYSLAMGLADGLQWGNNQKGILAALAMQEMTLIMRTIKRNPAILQTPAGFPDFLATAFSPSSRNRTLGEEIVRSGACSFQSEGLIALPSLIKRLQGKTQAFAILHTMRKTLLQGRHQEIDVLFARLLTPPTYASPKTLLSRP